MGCDFSSIGNFSVSVRDCHIKDGQPKEYYEKFMVYCEFMDEKNSDKWDVAIPLLKLGKLEKLKKNYRFKPEFNLMKILWEEIEKREFIVEGYIGIVSYYHEHETGKKIYKHYYLVSNIGEEPIELSSPARSVNIPSHHVHDYNEHKWIIENGLKFLVML